MKTDSHSQFPHFSVVIHHCTEIKDKRVIFPRVIITYVKGTQAAINKHTSLTYNQTLFADLPADV